MARQTLDGNINMRVNADALATFKEKCVGIADHQVVIRDFIDAHNDGRLTIKPTTEQQELYK